MFDDSWARGRVGGVDFVDVVPGAFVLVFVFVVVVVVVFFFFFLFAFFAFFVVVFVGRLRGAVLVLAGRDYLDAGRILVGEVVFVFKGASVVVDCDSLPESDGHVSVALDMIASLGRRDGDARRALPSRGARLDRTPGCAVGHGSTMGKMGYD
jgi:hypothetical protein